ncbi:MAG: hypothetical protein ACYC1E_13145 [Propionibacteriaceae bacterium]
MTAAYDPDELRGWTARQILSEDAKWVADVALSSRGPDACGAYTALMLSHHFVRIAFEGATAIRSSNPHMGEPGLAALLTDNYQTVTERARHVTKLLDDNKKTYPLILQEIRDVYEHNHNTLTGHAPRLLRGLEHDLGLYYLGDSVVCATIPTAYRLGLDPVDTTSMAGQDIHQVSMEWGSTISVLSAATLRHPSVAPTLTMTDCGITYRDCLAKAYLKRKYERVFPLELKLLLLMIEADLNTNLLFLPRTQVGHEMPVFRARTVTLYHSLSTLTEIAAQYEQISSARMDDLRSLLSNPTTMRLLSPGGKNVRNRCVHYEMNDPKTIPDWNYPMQGIVEAVNPGMTWSLFNQDILDVTQQLASLLAVWRPARRSSCRP